MSREEGDETGSGGGWSAGNVATRDPTKGTERDGSVKTEIVEEPFLKQGTYSVRGCDRERGRNKKKYRKRVSTV